MLQPIKKLPGVLAFQRGHVLSDALMYSRVAGEDKPVAVVRHGIRGTQNVAAKKDGGIARVSNVQITETARLDPDAESLVVRFSVAFLDIANALFSCVGENKEDADMLRNMLDDFVSRAKGSEGLEEVARRYARGIANGRWLWRNRSIAKSISIRVTNMSGVELAHFDARQIPLNHFEDYTPGEHTVGAEIARQMRGDSMDRLTVEAVLELRAPGNLEVFPSQNYVEGKFKPDGFARPLYKVNLADISKTRDPMSFADTQITGYAALRDQKLSNAIRTIDTWYPAYSDTGVPIPVEPNGAHLGLQEFFRESSKKNSAFDLLKRLATIDPDSPEGMFCIAILDRGGVYGESDKGEKERKAKDQKAAAESEVEGIEEEFE